MLRPMADYVVVLPDPIQAVASQTIILPQSTGIIDSQKQYGRVGTVAAVGPGKYDKKGRFIPLSIHVGDRVTWGEFVFPEYHEDGKTYIIIQEADITGIVEQEEVT